MVVFNSVRLILTPFFSQFSVRASSSAPKVAVLGATGGVGQPLSLLLKLNTKIAKLALYDVDGTEGVAADLAQVDTNTKVSVHTGLTEISAALKDADIVAITAGAARRPGMTRDDLFASNASVIRDLSKLTARICPTALIAFITNPINSLVPIVCEVYKESKIPDFNRIFGVTTLDSLCAKTLVADLKAIPAAEIQVLVIGGHSGTTIIPVFSQIKPDVKLSDSEISMLTEKIREAGSNVVTAKAGAGSATLSSAVAAYRFVDSLLLALRGEKVIQTAFVKSDLVKGVEYFASALEIGANGIEKILPFGTLSGFEQELLDIALADIRANIEKGVKFIHKETD